MFFQYSYDQWTLWVGVESIALLLLAYILKNMTFTFIFKCFKRTHATWKLMAEGISSLIWFILTLFSNIVRVPLEVLSFTIPVFFTQWSRPCKLIYILSVGIVYDCICRRQSLFEIRENESNECFLYLCLYTSIRCASKFMCGACNGRTRLKRCFFFFFYISEIC